MQFPRDIFDGSIETNLNAVQFMKVYNDLTGGLVADIRTIDKRNWFVSYEGHRFEIVTNEDNVVVGMFGRDE